MLYTSKPLYWNGTNKPYFHTNVGISSDNGNYSLLVNHSTSFGGRAANLGFLLRSKSSHGPLKSHS